MDCPHAAHPPARLAPDVQIEVLLALSGNGKRIALQIGYAGVTVV